MSLFPFLRSYDLFSTQEPEYVLKIKSRLLLPCSSSPMTPHHIWTEIQIPLISSQGFYRTCLGLLLGLNCNNSFLPTLLQPHCRPCVYAKHEQGSTARPLYLQLSLAGMFFPHIFTWPFLIPLQTLLKCYFSQRPLSPPRLKSSPLILTPAPLLSVSLSYFYS